MRESDEKLIERFGNYLRLRKLSLTKERRQTSVMVCRMKNHFTVDELFVSMHQAGTKTSKATLYRTIQLLLEARILREVALGGRETRYELAESGYYHGHMICQHCGKVIEFKTTSLEKALHKASLSQEFLMLTAQATISGICTQCAEANPQSLRKQVCVPILRYAQSRVN